VEGGVTGGGAPLSSPLKFSTLIVL